MAQKSAQPITSVEHIPGSERGQGFPPFDAHTFASQLLWLALAFIALYLRMSLVAFPGLTPTQKARPGRVGATPAEAPHFKAASAPAVAAHKKGIAEAGGRAQPPPNEPRKKAGAAAEAR